MEFKKRWGFGFGTVFSLIIIYFIHLYAKDKGWALLTFLFKWYLIIIGILIALPLLIILLVLLFSLLIFLIVMIKSGRFGKINKKYKKHKEYIDAEYKVKD